MLSWEFAQARHIDRSARLAQALAAALAAEPSMRSAAARQAPLRMLAGVNAPAAMVELAYLTNASQDSLASSDEFINGAAEALLNGIAQFLLQPVDTGRR
jgi:N-acetylmuramoyl-L-alanine amidase